MLASTLGRKQKWSRSAKGVGRGDNRKRIVGETRRGSYKDFDLSDKSSNTPNCRRKKIVLTTEGGANRVRKEEG